MTCTEENELIFSDEVFMQLKFTPQVVTSGGQKQGHVQTMCTEENEFIFSDEVFMQLKFPPNRT